MKRPFLWLILIVTLIAVYFAPQADGNEVVVTPAKAVRQPIHNVSTVARQASRVEPNAVDLQIRPRQTEQDLGNVFASLSWVPPPPKVTAKPAETAPAVEAPQLPFRFLGRLVEDGKTAYFLQLNDRNLVMHIGDTVDKTYTLESINGGTLIFAYLPLNKKQTLVVGEVD